MCNDGTVDSEYQFQPTSQLSLHERVRLLILKSKLQSNAYATDDNEYVLREIPEYGRQFL